MNAEELNQFGAPLFSRKEEIAKKTERPESYYPIEIMGRLQNIPVISVRIEMPVYRLANGRTKSAQLEYLTKHKDVPRDIFNADHDSYEAQSIQHLLLLQLVKDEDLLQTFASGEMEQVEPIICTNTGVVVNGNRRLCAWRKLFYENKEKYKSFETIRIAVLPDMDEKAILDIEKRLQIQRTMRAEYRWHTKALMAEIELKNGAKETALAKSYGLKKKELMNLIESRRIAELFLERVGHQDEWSLLDKSYYAFESIVVGSRKIYSQTHKELFEKIAFDLITRNLDQMEDTPSGRLYSTIKERAEHIEAIAEELAKKMEPEVPDNPQANENADDPDSNVAMGPVVEDVPNVTEPDKKNEEDDDDEDDFTLLVGGETIEPDSAGKVSSAIDNGAEIPQESIDRIIDAQVALKNEKDKATFFTKQLASIIADLDFAIGNGLDESTKTDAVPEQIKTIREKLDYIEGWLLGRK